MSALGMASLGTQCSNKALGMATLGIFCAAIAPPTLYNHECTPIAAELTQFATSGELRYTYLAVEGRVVTLTAVIRTLEVKAEDRNDAVAAADPVTDLVASVTWTAIQPENVTLALQSENTQTLIQPELRVVSITAEDRIDGAGVC